jgi:hypothetical protein
LSKTEETKTRKRSGRKDRKLGQKKKAEDKMKEKRVSSLAIILLYLSSSLSSPSTYLP